MLEERTDEGGGGREEGGRGLGDSALFEGVSSGTEERGMAAAAEGTGGAGLALRAVCWLGLAPC